MLSNVAASLGQDFSPYLPAALEKAFESLNQKDTVGADGSEKENEGSVSLNSQEDSEDEEEGDNELDRRLILHTGEKLTRLQVNLSCTKTCHTLASGTAPATAKPFTSIGVCLYGKWCRS